MELDTWCMCMLVSVGIPVGNRVSFFVTLTYCAYTVDGMTHRNHRNNPLVDDVPVMTGLANITRSDLPPAGVAPNPDHGIALNLPTATVMLLQKGIHTVKILATGSAPVCGQYAWELPVNGKAMQCASSTNRCEVEGPQMMLLLMMCVFAMFIVHAWGQRWRVVGRTQEV